MMSSEPYVLPDGKKPRNVKNYNSSLVISLLRSEEPISITTMAEMTSLSKTTISKIYMHLADEKAIIPVGRGSSTVEGGKRPVLYTLNPDYSYGLLLSLGFADHISCTVFDYTGANIAYKRVETDGEEPYEAVMQKVYDLVTAMLVQTKIPQEKICGAVVSFDGIVDTINGVILSSANRNWKGTRDVRADLISRFPFLSSVLVDNACCFSGYAELASPDALPGNKMVITWNADRTLGCSMIAGRQLVVNNEGITGGFGHVLIDTASQIQCRCGLKGCLQSVLSYEAACDYIERVYTQYPDSIITKKYLNGTYSMEDVFLYAGEDEFASVLLDFIVNYFAILLYNVFSLHSAQKVILQGMFGLSGDIFLKRLKKRVLNFNNLHLYRELDIRYSPYNAGGVYDGINPYTKGASMRLFDQAAHALAEF